MPEREVVEVVIVEAEPKSPTPAPALPSQGHGLSRVSPDALLWILIIEFLGLVGLWVAWQWEWPGFDHTHLPPLMYGVLPLAVPYFGALGGLGNAMWSMVKHWKKYDSPKQETRDREKRTWAAWTVMQSFIGAIFGTAGALIVVLVTQTVTLGTDAAAVTPTGMGFLAVVAFVVGFRQAAFQNLVSHVTTAILEPGTAKDKDSGVA